MPKVHLLVASVSIISMVLQPVAYGQTQVNFAAQALKQYVKQNQKSGKAITVKEFWNKNKTKLHPDWQEKFYPGIELQKNEAVPQMEVISVKGPGGKDTARLVITLASKKTISMEYLGAKDKFARINNQVISYNDLFTGDGLMEKLSQDSVVRGEMERNTTAAIKASMTLPYQTFVKMTPRERAEYFVNLRHVVQAATEVSYIKINSKPTEAKEEKTSFIQFLLEKAYAASNQPDTCIIAGYVGEEVEIQVKGKIDRYCDHTKGLSRTAQDIREEGSASTITRQSTMMTAARGSCASNEVHCNPFIFGFQRAGGQSMCVTAERKNPVFQVATKTCNERSPLRPGSLAADTQAMIASLLSKSQNKSEEEIRKLYFDKDGKVIDAKTYKELMDTVVADFDKFIDRGLATCGIRGFTGAGVKGHSIDKNMDSACTALYERKLAFDQGKKLIEGKYDNPSPTPAPIAPLPDPVKPICEQPGDTCELKAAQDGRGICNQELKCVAVVPAPNEPPKENACGPMMEPDFDASGKPVCVGRSAVAMYKKNTEKLKKKNDEWSCGIICPLAIGALFVGASYMFTKSNQKNKPGVYIPPAPPGPFTPIPQPTPITPVPPLIPTLPPPLPATAETPSTATPSPAPAAGGSVR